jgi:hypothetical protein
MAAVDPDVPTKAVAGCVREQGASRQISTHAARHALLGKTMQGTPVNLVG